MNREDYEYEGVVYRHKKSNTLHLLLHNKLTPIGELNMNDDKINVVATDCTSLKKGDAIVRTLGGAVSMKLKVTDVTDDLVICGPWKFDRATGAEIDEVLGWGVGETGSTIKPYIEEEYEIS